MNTHRARIRDHAARVAALVVMATLFGLARLPTLSSAERAELAGRFAFSRHSIAMPAELEPRSRREVSPSLEGHAGWISAVGAAVALADLDGDGLPNDLCHVDPRIDQVRIAPVVGSGARFRSFALEPPAGAFDARTTAPMGCIPRDLDENGATDLFVYYWGRPPVAFLRRRGSAGTSAADYVAREIVARQERWYSNAATFADFDGDGHLDFVLGNYFQDGASILDRSARTPDRMQHSMSRAYNGGRNRLFRWVGAARGAEPGVEYEEVEGVFDRRSVEAWTLAVGAADLDGDLLPELYFANDFGPDRLYHNRSEAGRIRFAPLVGVKHLTTPSSKVLGRDSFKGMGVDFADLNADGLLDIYVSNIATDYALHESHFVYVSTGDVGAMARGIAPYDDHSEPLGLSRSGWGWETRFGDFDNDGTVEALQATGFLKGHTNRWPELQELATGNDELLRLPFFWPSFGAGSDLSGHQRNPFFVRAADGRYYDIAAELGIDEPQVTRGIATADVDGDGDLDFVVANQWETSALYRNDAPPRSFLGLNLLLPAGAGTRPAVGASVRVEGPRGPLVAQVDGGNGHSGVRSPGLHFGLGDLPPATPVSVSIRWRDAGGSVRERVLALRPGWHTVVLEEAVRSGG